MRMQLHSKKTQLMVMRARTKALTLQVLTRFSVADVLITFTIGTSIPTLLLFYETMTPDGWVFDLRSVPSPFLLGTSVGLLWPITVSNIRLSWPLRTELMFPTDRFL